MHRSLQLTGAFMLGHEPLVVALSRRLGTKVPLFSNFTALILNYTCFAGCHFTLPRARQLGAEVVVARCAWDGQV